MKYKDGPFDGQTANPKLVKAMERLMTAMITDSYGAYGLYTYMGDHLLFEGKEEDAKSPERMSPSGVPEPPAV